MSRALPVLLLLLVGATGIGLCLTVLAPPATSAGGPGAARVPVAGEMPQGHLYTGITEQPNDLNPFTTGGGVARAYVLGFTHDTLLDIDPVSGQLRASLAEAWQLAADGMSMTVTLREGVQFCDGAPLTVDDVLFTFEVASTPDIVLGSIGEGMNLVDAATRLPGTPARVRIDFDRRYFAAGQVVGDNWLVVQKKWFLERIAEQARRDGVPVPAVGAPGFGALLAKLTSSPGPGTGPYRFADDREQRPSWRRGRDLTLFRNEHSWQRKAQPGCWNLGGVRLLFVTDDAARHATLHQRGVDWFSAPDLRAVLASDAGLEADYRREVYDKPSLGAYLVQWNTQRPQLADPRVRRALAMLFDREQIATRILGGAGRPAVAFGKPDQPGYPHDQAPIPCDPPAARRLLRDAGFRPEDGTRLHVVLMVPAEVPWFRQMGELAADQARAAGVDLQLQVVMHKEIMDRRSGTDWDGALLLISMPSFGDPYELFHSKGGRNAMHWSHPAADELLEQQRLETDPLRRGDLLEQFHRLVAAEQPVALLVHPLAEILIGTHLQNAVPGPRGLWPERFWMPAEFQRPGP